MEMWLCEMWFGGDLFEMIFDDLVGGMCGKFEIWLILNLKYGNVDDDDLRKLEKVFENEVVYVVFRLMLCVNLGLDCIRIVRIFALTLSSANENLEMCCEMCCVL